MYKDLFIMGNKTNKFIHKFCFINNIASYMFRPPILAIFEVYITHNVKTNIKC